MNYRRLGRSGLKVSELCLGTWINFGDRLDDTQSFAVLDAAVEEGIDFFDTADVYAGGKAEEVIGRWMKTKDRRALTIATKCRWRQAYPGCMPRQPAPPADRVHRPLSDPRS
jgi:aryl-alcohol dehydrogenase-like predicted oxidoreductase